MKNPSNYILYILICLFCISCGIYSFNGASIDKKAETISISYFINSASTKQPTLSQVLTEKLKDYFTQQTNLIINEDDGHLNFKGEIIKYEIKPMAIQSNETASQNRLTISVKVKFNNIYNSEYDFSHTFTRYRDYQSSQNLSDIETVLINEISNELVDDIFNKSVVNW